MFDVSDLNPQQREAATTVDGPVLILAGAGTGKTRVITHRIAWMLSRGIPPGNILAVTFTNKAAREMLQRVQQLVPRRKSSNGEKPERPTMCTFHSLCVRILRRHIDKIGYKPNFTIYDDTEQLGVIKRVLSSMNLGDEKVKPGDVLAILSRIRNASDDQPIIVDPRTLALARHLRRHYESALRAANAVDFDDLILLTLRLFRERQDALDECRQRYQYVMVDEYQDTNGAQFDLVRALAENHRNLCVVGDDDQSIYGWRGAQVANLLDFEKYFPEVKVVRLEQNYRSTNNILNAANHVIRHNPRRRGKQLWSRHGDGDKIRMVACEHDEAEAQFLVDEIQLNKMSRAIPWGDQAILFRTNQQSRPLEAALRRSGIRYRIVGGQSFFDRLEIRDFLAYLKVLSNPNDDASLLRIANVPTRGLSDATLERMITASHERHCSVFTAMRHTDVQEQFQARTQESIREFVLFLENARQRLEQAATGQPLAPWAEGILTETGYWEHLRRSERNIETAENRVRNLKEMIASLDTIPDVNPGMPAMQRLSEALSDLALDTSRNSEEEKAGDEVTLITMHSCKGLEFPHVFIVGLEEGLLPHNRSKEEGTLDEERRLFYVALTRAMRTLTLSYALGRKKYGQLLPSHPSSFLRELPPELVISEDASARKPVAAGAGKSLFASMRQAANK
ncbi:MAG: UvrD-helicase domain-containing protein [Verrucomicrobiales bacterium]|nr:UvrD-helicase domain-containing protein [Verrucomicrobiales bacterium]